MLGVELTPAELHQLKSEGGLFHQSEEAELLEVDGEMREALLYQVFTLAVEAVWISLGNQFAADKQKERVVRGPTSKSTECSSGG